LTQALSCALTSTTAKSQMANNLRLVEALGHAVTHFERSFSGTGRAFARDLLSQSGIEEGQPVPSL